MIVGGAIFSMISASNASILAGSRVAVVDESPGASAGAGRLRERRTKTPVAALAAVGGSIAVFALALPLQVACPLRQLGAVAGAFDGECGFDRAPPAVSGHCSAVSRALRSVAACVGHRGQRLSDAPGFRHGRRCWRWPPSRRASRVRGRGALRGAGRVRAGLEGGGVARVAVRSGLSRSVAGVQSQHRGAAPAAGFVDRSRAGRRGHLVARGPGARAIAAVAGARPCGPGKRGNGRP